MQFTQAAVLPFANLATGGNFAFLPPATQAAVLGSLQPLATFGFRAAIIDSAAASIAKQWSNELQINYSSEKLQATFGALWFHSDDEAGGPPGLQNTVTFGTFFSPTGVIPLGNEGRYFNKATSLAAYAQLEYKITPELEVVAGARVTHDKKTSQFRWNVLNSTTGVVSPRPLIVPPEYSKTKPNFLVGLNWKPNADTLVYAKYSTSFVSGGSTAGITYEPETASSFELGLKADFLDHRLRTNLALFHVDYKHFQSPGSTTTPSSTATILPTLISLYGAVTANELVGSLSTFVSDQGSVRAKGFELEVTAAPSRGLTMGGSVGYTDVSFPFLTPATLAGNGGELAVTARPKWTTSVYAAYETRPLFGDATLLFRMDGQYRSRIRYNLHPKTDPFTENLAVSTVAGFMLVNGRIALRHLKVGPADAELAFWAKNITNRKDAIFVLPTPLAVSANYVAARTFGVDLSLDF